ncbi:MAG: L,D-transpeptidase [Clostridiales bacterium]|nr:L,D-transpeptidase [Candidatus Crickella equi]
MKKITKKLLSILLVVTMCVTSLGVVSFAETTSVATSTTIDTANYSLTGKHPSFKWNTVTLESGDDVLYAIHCWSNGSSYSTGKKFFSKSGITNTKYTAAKSLNYIDFPYSYQVCAYADGESPDWSTAITRTISLPGEMSIAAPTNVTAKITYPSKANNTSKLGEIVQQDNTVTVSWDVEDSSQYDRFEIYRVNASGNRTLASTVKASASKTHYSDKHQSAQGTFQFVVSACPKGSLYPCILLESEPTQSLEIKAKCLCKGVEDIPKNLYWTAKAKKNISIYKSAGGKKIGTLKKGKSLECTWKFAPTTFGFWEEPSWVQVKYNGGKAWLKWSQVKMCWHITYNDFAWSVKEDFINSEDIGSSTNYLIWISRHAQRTNVFHKEGGKWKLIKVYDCNTGNYYQPLKGGKYSITGHEFKKIKEHRNGRLYYFTYSTKFKGSGTFHTRCRWVDTGNLRNSIKRHPTTKGCCRLYDAAAKYVYNLPAGTRVYIH